MRQVPNLLLDVLGSNATWRAAFGVVAALWGLVTRR